MLETRIPRVRLLPRAKDRACRLGWYFNSAAALITRARVEFLTTLRSLSTRETVAVETPAFLATASRFLRSTFLAGNMISRGLRSPQILTGRKQVLKRSGPENPGFRQQGCHPR